MAEPRKEREPFHVTVAQKLIDRLEKGTAPWQRPWEPGVPSSHLPHNPVTGKRYNGINILQLMSEGYEDTRWMTYKQAEAQGWQVRKGEKGTPVQYWKFAEEVEKTDENGNLVRNSKGEIEKETVQLERPRVFWATVFNAEQIDGIPERTLKMPEWDPLERAEAIIQASGVKVSHDQSDRAFYRVSTDRVHMPGRDQFPSADRYYATKLHEMGHWTGHPSRLGRPVGQNPFGSEEYAKEELRAEIASMIIGDELGIGHDPEQHVAYVKSWIKVLKDDPMEIFRAAADAEKIQKFILAFEQQQEQQQGQEQQQATTPEAPHEASKGGRLEALHLVKAKQQQEAKMDPKEPAQEKTYLSVPFKEKNEAKALGARWDSKATSWYVPQGEDLSLFTKWRQAPQPDKGSELEAGQDVPREPAPVQAVAEKKFLAVPYGEREQASALGARWDKAAKSWYIGQGDDPEKFKRWDPAFIAQQPKITVQEEFKEACKAAGLVLEGEPIMDGRRYRVALVDDKRGEKNGVYIGHLDGHPAGYIKNFRTGIAMNWKSKGYDATDEEKAKLNAEAAEKLQQREAERAAQHEAISARVQGEIQRLVEPTDRTPYQEDKGIGINKGVLTDRAGKRTYIPAQDISGKIWTMQYIQEDGTKRFPKGGKKEGCFHVVGGTDALAKAPVLAVGEGYATMTTASECLGFATVVAFDSGNLKQVAASLQKKYPGKPLLFIADDDVLSAEKSPLGINAGRMKAEAAAKELGGMAVFPVFAPGEARKGLSDFNDLATRSELGREAADRQLKAAMSQSINNARDLARQQAKSRQHEQSVGMSR